MMSNLTHDVVLLATEWGPRTLLRAQLIEEGLDVRAVDAWPDMRRYMRPGELPHLAIVDLQGLPDPDRVLADLHVLMPPGHVLVLTALGTVTADRVKRLGFRVMNRPFEVSGVVATALEAIRS